MRNPSPTTLSRVCRALWCLEATYEESKPPLGEGGLEAVKLLWKLPMRNPSRRVQFEHRDALEGLEATYEESK